MSTRKARVEAAEDALRSALAESERSSEQLMLSQRWDSLTRPEKRRWVQNFQVRVTVQHGNERALDRIRMWVHNTPLDP